MGRQTPDVRRLMEYRVAAMFRHDRRGRMLVVNQWDGGEPPRFYLARTNRGNVWRVRADVPDRVARRLEALAADEPPMHDHRLPPVHASAYVQVLDQLHATTTESSPIYWFGHPVAPRAEAVVVDGTNARLLHGGLESWLPDVPHRQPMVAVVEDGHAVSVCASVRIGGRSHEAGVETVPAYRRLGHAANAVATWALEVQRRGIGTLFYSTTWDNVASQGVARRLGLTFIGADFSID